MNPVQTQLEGEICESSRGSFASPYSRHRSNGREHDDVLFLRASKFAAAVGPSNSCPGPYLFTELALPGAGAGAITSFVLCVPYHSCAPLHFPLHISHPGASGSFPQPYSSQWRHHHIVGNNLSIFGLWIPPPRDASLPLWKFESIRRRTL